MSFQLNLSVSLTYVTRYSTNLPAMYRVQRSTNFPTQDLAFEISLTLWLNWTQVISLRWGGWSHVASAPFCAWNMNDVITTGLRQGCLPHPKSSPKPKIKLGLAIGYKTDEVVSKNRYPGQYRNWQDRLFSLWGSHSSEPWKKEAVYQSKIFIKWTKK